jgi:chromosome segregation ATPase
MPKTFLIAVLGAVVCLASPARADDADKQRAARLEAELDGARAEATRVKAEVTHLREAYNQLSENATRATRSITALTNTLNAIRDMGTAQRQQLDALRARIAKRPSDDPVRLEQELRQAQEEHARDVTRLETMVAQLNARSSEKAMAMALVEQRLAGVLNKRASDMETLQARLAAAEAKEQRALTSLNKVLAAEQQGQAEDDASNAELVVALTRRVHRGAIALTNAENKLAQVKAQSARDVAALQAQLAAAEVRIKQLSDR